ncbi:hypothetical protein Taro_055186, partial [Colocasia esculenta]|nr:hypothetical protein [Colocasia esculenta]
QQFDVILVVLPRLFARCLALEGSSHSEVVSISWDPHPREPVEGGIRATSVLELAAHVWDAEGFGVLSWHRSDNPVSHCLSLRWFRSHVVVLGVGPQLGQAAVLCLVREAHPPYFHQLGDRRHGSSVSDGLRRRLWRRVVVSSSESELCELL